MGAGADAAALPVSTGIIELAASLEPVSVLQQLMSTRECMACSILVS